MEGTINQGVNVMTDGREQKSMSNMLRAIANGHSSQLLATTALRIKGGSASALVQTNANGYAVVNGKLTKIATSTDLPALSGTVTNAKFNVFAFFATDSAATPTLQSVMGIEATTLAGVVFPPIGEGKALVGFVIINPTGTGNFVGGTTVLDDATVVPNAVFVNTPNMFDPTILLG